ncbi:major capsid protein [Clostridium formicaceticum]|nr:major capsid protein [Clostridium formicaceticum]
MKGHNGLPVALMPSAFDTKATLRDRIGISKIETEMPFFREAMRIGEKERQELNKAAGSMNSAYVMPIIQRIYDDVNNLVEGAEVNNERMRMQLLSTGKISITANRVNYDYGYKFSSEHKETLLTGARWSNVESSTPIQDIQRWVNKIEESTGDKPTRAICTLKTWNYLLTNKSIRLDMNPIGADNIILTDNMLRQYLSAKLGLTVAVYNKKYALTDGSTHQFFPDDVFTLIPEGNLGNTYFGTTPEESDLMSGNTDAKVQIVNTGVAITTIKEPHPVNVQTIVSEIALPSFEKIDSIFIAKVNEEL